LSDETEAPIPAPTLRTALRTWAYIGFNSVGGPAGQIAVMHRVIVEDKRWLSEERFLHALNFCMLLPGPEATQLATYTGWLLHGVRGGIAAGLLFVLPGALFMLALTMAYAAWQDVPAVDAVMFGMKAAVLAIVVEAMQRISQRALKDRFAYAIAAAAFLAIFLFKVPFPLVVLAAALTGWWRSRGALPAPEVGEEMPPARLEHAHTLRTLFVWGGLWLAPLAALLFLFGPGSTWFQIGLFFSKTAVVTFGGAYAVLAYIAQQAVDTYHWMLPHEMADGLAFAETTPGPLILVTQFVGFLAAWRDPGILSPMLAGALGATLTIWVTFAPCFLWIFLGAPYIEALRHHHGLSAALAAITSAVVGVVLNLAMWFGLHVLFEEVSDIPLGPLHVPAPNWHSLDIPALLLTLAALIAVLRFRAGVLPVLAVCAIAGAAWKLSMGG
jgi:chromate transporter